MPERMRGPGSFSVQERVRAQSCSPPDCRLRAYTMPGQAPTNELPEPAPRNAAPGREPPNGQTEAGQRAWLPEQGLPGGPGPFSEPEHGAAEVRYAAEN